MCPAAGSVATNKQEGEGKAEQRQRQCRQQRDRSRSLVDYKGRGPHPLLSCEQTMRMVVCRCRGGSNQGQGGARNLQAHSLNVADRAQHRWWLRIGHLATVAGGKQRQEHPGGQVL